MLVRGCGSWGGGSPLPTSHSAAASRRSTASSAPKTGDSIGGRRNEGYSEAGECPPLSPAPPSGWLIFAICPCGLRLSDSIQDFSSCSCKASSAVADEADEEAGVAGLAEHEEQ
ncbi:hypothetical protein GW17_00060177 [Ensete ventricosum]|nr:hypothetical protein GW17_00060177 [Ensete ventricosum]